jgi:hypothetical protein
MMAKAAKKRVNSVREYIASKPKESRASLEAVRRAILGAIPTVHEGLAEPSSRTFCIFVRELSSLSRSPSRVGGRPQCPRGVEQRERTSDDHPP